MIIVYTGNGKGKTSACIGQAMRALGRDFAVGFGQFMKQPGCAGEQTVLARLLGDDFLAGGKGFLRREEDRPAHREAKQCKKSLCRYIFKQRILIFLMKKNKNF